jgi:hypothetical protein
MNIDTLQNFVDNYSSSDFDRIKFDWNNKHGDEFKDNNYEFRNSLIEFILPQLNSINILLVRDLYIEYSKFAREAWGASKNFGLLGGQLLLRDYKTYLLDYLEGASQSMDTYLASGQIKIPTELAREIVSYMISENKSEKDERKKSLLSNNGFLERFDWLSKKEN